MWLARRAVMGEDVLLAVAVEIDRKGVLLVRAEGGLDPLGLLVDQPRAGRDGVDEPFVPVPDCPDTREAREELRPGLLRWIETRVGARAALR